MDAFWQLSDGCLTTVENGKMQYNKNKCLLYVKKWLESSEKYK